MSRVSVHLALSGRPLARCEARLEGMDESLVTDERGRLAVELPEGRYEGVVEQDGKRLRFGLVSAPGVRRIRVDLREPEQPLDDPRVLGAMPARRYVPLRLIGRGGIGRVFKCRDTALDRLVAVKLLNEDFAGTAAERDGFVSEARLLAQLDNPHLLRVYDVGVHEGRPYLVVQFVDGPNLEELLVAEQQLDTGSAAAAGIQLAHALLAVHEAGLLHRDVKPSNGLVDRDGLVRLADFGLVRPILDLRDPRSRVAGTPAYMSPEALQGRPLGPASDIFALGATLFDLTAGQPPFAETTDLVARVLEPPPRLGDVLPDADPALSDLVRRMMSRRPKARPDASEVIDALIPIATSVPYRDDVLYLPRLSTTTLGLRARTGSMEGEVVRAPAATPDPGELQLTFGSGEPGGSGPGRKSGTAWILAGLLAVVVSAAAAGVLLSPEPAGQRGQAAARSGEAAEAPVAVEGAEPGDSTGSVETARPAEVAGEAEIAAAVDTGEAAGARTPAEALAAGRELAGARGTELALRIGLQARLLVDDLQAGGPAEAHGALAEPGDSEVSEPAARPDSERGRRRSERDDGRAHGREVEAHTASVPADETAESELGAAVGSGAAAAEETLAPVEPPGEGAPPPMRAPDEEAGSRTAPGGTEPARTLERVEGAEQGGGTAEQEPSEDEEDGDHEEAGENEGEGEGDHEEAGEQEVIRPPVSF